MKRPITVTTKVIAAAVGTVIVFGLGFGLGDVLPQLGAKPLPTIPKPSSNAAVPARACPQQHPASTPLLDGLGYGPYHAGQDPNYGIYPSDEEVDADMSTLACLTRNIRIYSSQGPAKRIVQDAAQLGMSVDLGIWIGKSDNEEERAANEREITAGIQLVNSEAVRTVTVGNEVLLRQDQTVDQLRADIERVHDAALAVAGHQVQVTTADSYRTWLGNRDLSRDVDFLTVHIYPFWEQKPIGGAVKFLADTYSDLQSKFPNRKIVIGETGWPSEGPPQGAAIPGAENQAAYFKGFIDWAAQRKVDYYYFDAFDESWKTESGVGAHWGLYREDGILKPALRELLPTAAPDTLDQRSYRDIFVGKPASGLGVGIDTSGQRRDWLAADQDQGTFTLQYPDRQSWGALFITSTHTPIPYGNRPGIDLSKYHSLTAEMRSMGGPSCVRLGVKDNVQLDDGSETTVQQCLTDIWSPVGIPLNAFMGADLSHLYIVFEVVFSTLAMNVQLRNVRYSMHPAGWPSTRSSAAPVPIAAPLPMTGALGDIYVGSLEPGLDIGIDTSGHRYGWLAADQGTLTLQYPDQQIWGAMFITVGKPVPPGNRPSMDLSRYRSLTADMRWGGGGDGCVRLGIKDSAQLDDGAEATVPECLTRDWSTARIPLSAFTGADLTHLYVVFEVVFANTAMNVQLRNIRYSTNDAPQPPTPSPATTPTPRPPGDIYVGSLEPGLGIGIDTSNHRFGWLTASQGTLTLQYPDQQIWGAMFITVGTPVPPGNRPGMDLSQYRSVTADIRWGGGGNGCVHLGIKDRGQPDDGSETTVPECASSTWSTIRIPLSAFTGADLTHLYVVFEVVFSNVPMTIQLRNIRYSTSDAPPPPTPTPTPTPTQRPLGDIYVGSLEPGLDIGIDTSFHKFGWLTANQGVLKLQYPDQQNWGAMFITVGTAVPPGNRPSVDLSQYRSLTAEVRWDGGGDGCVHVGVQDNVQQDGTETTVRECLTSSWSTVSIPLSAFTGADLTHLYVVFEVVFANVSMTIELRNIRYST